MLYKILLVIASVFSMLASSLMPAGFISNPLGQEDASSGAALVPLQKLTTLDGAGRPEAVSALWASIDGDRVDHDVTGHGYLKELQFKVGIRAAAAKTLAIGESLLPLSPTDTITVREFTGKFVVTGAGTDSMLVLLDGEVQATFVNEAHVEKIRTEGRTSVPKTPANLAYVVLDVGSGARQTTVDLAPGGDSVATGGETTGVVSIPVRWLRIGDNAVTDYAWGEGHVPHLDFLAKAGTERLVIGGKSRTFEEETRVVVDGFVGSYVLFKNDKGELLLKLDGFAESIGLKPGHGGDALGLTPKPIASFAYEPQPPTTSDTVVFVDMSEAPEGASILLREWNFGDGTISTANAPKHRFKDPGRSYAVTLVVTDSNLERSDPHTQTIIPLNSRPVAEFDFTPKLATDLDSVQFIDRSWDVDGPIVSWLWEFGDGSGSSTDASPAHIFPDDGAYTVTLTVRDTAGATNAISKVISVRNVRPTASLAFTPTDPTLLDEIEFRDLSTDPDGSIVESKWTFGDGSPIATGSIVRHQYSLVGDYPVSLTTKDDDGETTTVSTTVRVRNLAPWAAFEIVTPAAERTTGSPICFLDTSTDDENAITSRAWRIGGASYSVAEPCHTFLEQGIATVNLTVRDQRGAASTIESTFLVLNGAPMADFVWAPVAARTNDNIIFSSTSSDPDGASDITGFLWTFPDATTSTDPTVTRSFADNGAYAVTLKVTDSAGHESTKTMSVLVANRPPRAQFVASDVTPVANEPVTVSDRSSDTDGTVVELIWAFDDGYTLRGPVGFGNLSNPTHAFLTPGLHRVTLTAVDDDLAESPPFNVLLDVLPPPPIADFSWAPSVPVAQESVVFVDESYGIGTNIVEWTWSFSEGGTSNLQNPEYQFGTFGTFPVTLTVRDDNSPRAQGSTTIDVLVNSRPIADFASSMPILHNDVTFTDASEDADGTIENWTWDFGDGSPLVYDRNPIHRWDSSGSYAVTLTVRDNLGTTASATSILRFDNRAPAAGFNVAPAPPVANSPTTFTSTSSDLENSIVDWQWTITTSDAVPVTIGAGTGPTFAFTFPQTGIYNARLRVVDADGGISIVTQKVRVASDLTKTLDFALVYPDGTPFNMASGTLLVTGTIKDGLTRALTALPAGSVTSPTPGTGRLTLAPGSWAAGDSIALLMKSAATGRTAMPPFPLDQPNFALGATAAETSPKVIHAFLAYEIIASVLPPLATTGQRGDYTEWTEISPGVYAFPNQSEIVFVRFTAVWERTSNPVVGEDLRINTMWHAVHTWFPGGDPTAIEILSTPLPGVLSVNEVVGPLGSLGEILYDVPILAPLPPPASGSLQNPVTPMYLPGWYTVRASLDISPQYSLVHPIAPTTTVQFFEDPLGLVRPTFSGNLIFG